MNTAEWIAHVDRLRTEDELLAVGEWHGYTETEPGSSPMKGAYYLVRWRSPTVAVSHDDPDEAIKLARVIERASLWRYIRKDEQPAVWAHDVDEGKYPVRTPEGP